jgi:hypothetical protein
MEMDSVGKRIFVCRSFIKVIARDGGTIFLDGFESTTLA